MMAGGCVLEPAETSTGNRELLYNWKLELLCERGGKVIGVHYLWLNIIYAIDPALTKTLWYTYFRNIDSEWNEDVGMNC